MSYARFSDDDWTSDVYVFADVGGGWTTFAASQHWDWESELPEPVEMTEDPDAWTERTNRVLAWFGMENGHWVVLPEADDYYHHDTPGECADNLERLQSLGFHVPAGVVEALRAEQQEMNR